MNDLSVNIKELTVSGIRIGTCDHVFHIEMPVKNLRKEDIDKAFNKELKKPCKECKGGRRR